MTQPAVRGNSGEIGGSYGSGDPDRSADLRVRDVLERYAALSGASLMHVGIDCFELRVPKPDRPAFGGRAVVRIALSIDALDLEPDAEMAVIGSAFVEQLIAAIRQYGARLLRGDVPASIAATAAHARLAIPVVNGVAGDAAISITRHVVGQLRARVAVRAGTSIIEHLVDSSLFDLSSGIPLTHDVARACTSYAGAESHGQGESQGQGETRDIVVVRGPPMSDLVPKMLGDLEQRLAPDVARQRVDADHALQFELARIDRYYRGILEDIGGRGSAIPDAGARRAVEAEHARRRAEEIRRHEVRAIVHPVQLTEWTVPMQQAEWSLMSRDGHASTVSAQRSLVGDGEWVIGCPTCGSVGVSSFVVCKENHTACGECGHICSVCDTGFCRSHGMLACHVDGQPACAEHAEECASCHQPHCTTHRATCDDGGHTACSTCVGACARCNRLVCDAHAIMSTATAPLGARRLCADCVRYCEGGTNEPVGVDEVECCASCDRVVCQKHHAACAVDGKVHCSRHLRRTDTSRRLVCERDRASCEYEPHAIFAADEVFVCASCGKVGCSAHTGVCAEDGSRHCGTHLARLEDRPGQVACEAHRSMCYADGKSYSVGGTRECPICVRQACAGHTVACPNCGRAVCKSDMTGGNKPTCRTCAALSDLTEPSDEVLQAAVALRGEAGMPKRWRQARDAIHLVVEMDFGWTRRTVFSVRHGDARAATVVRHSVLGRSVEKGEG